MINDRRVDLELGQELTGELLHGYNVQYGTVHGGAGPQYYYVFVHDVQTESDTTAYGNRYRGKVFITMSVTTIIQGRPHFFTSQSTLDAADFTELPTPITTQSSDESNTYDGHLAPACLGDE